MIAQSVDLTTQFNANNSVIIETSNWQNVVVHLNGTPSGTISITGSNDGGAITGAVDDNPSTALNFTAIQATDMSSGTAVTAIAAAGNFKIINLPKYVKIGGASAATTGKLIVFFTTPV